MIDKCVCDEGFIWIPSNCECECNKSCDVGEYQDYKNCECRKKSADKLVDECTENIDEVKIASENNHKNKYSSCTLCIVLFSIIFAINIGIGAYFVYCKYINRDKETASRYDYVYQKAIGKLTNGKRGQTNRDQKMNLLFLQRHY